MSFNCQRCRQTLQISSNLLSQPETSSSASPNSLASPELISLTSKSVNHQPQHNSLSTRLAHSSSLHSILSQLNSIPSVKNGSVKDGKQRLKENSIRLEHPLCTECTRALLDIMESQVNVKRKERDALVSWKVEAIGGAGDAQDAEQMEKLKLEISQMSQEYDSSRSKLREAESERLALEEELRQIELEEKEMESQEIKFWASHRSSLLLHSTLSSQTSSLQASISNSKTLLSRLNATDVYNDAFCIGQDSGVATINGLRLGRSLTTSTTSHSSSSRSDRTTERSNEKRSLEPIPIEWSEINAAWGQVSLLLETLRNKVGILEWENGWRIFPRGSSSWLEKIEKGVEKGEKYELYNTSNWELGKLLHSRRFDNAMVGYLDCLRQLGEWVEIKSEGQKDAVKLPHIINKDRIGGASIRLQFGNDENWTRALRHVLLTLKILLSWIVKNTSDDNP